MKVVEIGKTAEGRPHLMAIITSPENFKKLDRYKEISRRLATAEGLTDDQARALAKEGKGVVWIDGGLHATEVLGAHQLIETVYQLVSRNDAETLRFLNDLVILAVHANPDGMELVSSWYMREKEPARRSERRAAAALRKVRRARQQSRLLHVQPAREHQHEQGALPGVVSAGHVQPPPDRPRRHGDVRPAVPRSVQLQLRSARADWHRPRRRRDGDPVRRRGQAGRDEPQGVELFDVVERRPSDHGVLPQHDRAADGDDRQPDADQHSVPAGEAAARLEPLLPDRAAADLALPPVD